VLASAEGFSARGNYAEAAAMLKPLADQGNVKAQSRLGQMYLEGQGVERNDQEGLRLARNAASLGDTDAQLRIGGLYEQGRGVPQNNFQAYVWYSAAARSGNAAASVSRDRVAGLLQAVEIEQAGKLAAAIARQAKER
jgi:TPR repeat protein